MHPESLDQRRRLSPDAEIAPPAGVIAEAAAAGRAGDGYAMARVLGCLEEQERFLATAGLEALHPLSAGPAARALAAALAASESELRWSTFTDPALVARWAEALIDRGEAALAIALVRRDTPWIAGEMLGDLAMRAIDAGRLEVAWRLYDAIDPMLKRVRARLRGALGVAAFEQGDELADDELTAAVRDAVRPPMQAVGGGAEIEALAALLEVLTALPPAHVAVTETVQQICAIAKDQAREQDTRTPAIQRALAACMRASSRDGAWLPVCRDLLQRGLSVSEERLDAELDSARRDDHPRGA